MSIKKSYFIFLSAGLVCAVLAVFLSRFHTFNNVDPHSSSTEKEKKYPVVIIDAGHGGEDGGAIGTNGVYEKDLNLKISLELEELFRSKQIPTRLTRTEDTLLYDKSTDYEGHKKALDMEARVAIANEYENAIFVSIHMNSFTQEKYSGLQVYYSENSPYSAVLAKEIQDMTSTNLQPSNNRKIKPSNNGIYLLDNIYHPSILIECGFLSNEEECNLLCNEEYQKRLSLIIFSAIMKYFDFYEYNQYDYT